LGRLTHRTAPGCTYFVTTKTWEHRAIFQVPENADTLISVIFRHRDRAAFQMHEFVVMPNHLHLLLTPSDETSLEKAIQLIKGGSSFEIHRIRGHKMEIWQPGFHEATVRDEGDYLGRRNYIRSNPVDARLVIQAEDWLYGSANSKFVLDPMPDRLRVSSGAKAHA
jgi:REP-associated tyrosine transposase